MSTTDDLYQVLFRNRRGREALTDPEPRSGAERTARGLTAEGYEVGSVMPVDNARAYMADRYDPEYRGVAVPDDLRTDGTPRHVYETWKRGVDAALDASGPKDFQWVIRVHWDDAHVSPAVGPFGQTEADRKMTELRRRLRDAELMPPRMTRELLRAPDVLDGWIQNRIDEAKLREDADRHRCDHCGQPIESTGGHDWIGPVPKPGEPQKRYHLSTDFPECRRASGACGEGDR